LLFSRRATTLKPSEPRIREAETVESESVRPAAPIDAEAICDI